ncbi:hypothetical protein [Stenotrophomonas sepilia]|uniref:hypothetical protein n=1 Tax=Stenotrophomonas sepilia TaxID=2860290 RepID=UPI002897EFAD|nr:hypothetical protein [Stenotrophomonas maltophilia]
MFIDETLHGPLMRNGRFCPPTALEKAEYTSAALRQLHREKNMAFMAARASLKKGRKLPLNAPRKRAPKKPRLPADLSTIDPLDYRMRLKAEGFVTASGVRYFMALLKLQGEGTQVTIPASTNLPAHTILEKVGKLSRAAGWNPSLHLSCCPTTLGLVVRWQRLNEPAPPPYSSRFGLDQLAGCGEFLDIPLSMFPNGMKRSVQVRAVYLDHAVSRRNVKRAKYPQIDVLPDDECRPGILTAVLKSADHDLQVNGRSLQPHS